MSVLLVGANPIVRLFVGERVSAFASVWVVDWSTHGSGTALVLWYDNTVRVLGASPVLAAWLERDFTRHFPEVAGLAWPTTTVEATPVEVQLDLDHLRVNAGNVTIEAGDVLDRRTFVTDAFDLGGVQHGLSLVLAPVSSGSIQVDGVNLPGRVVVEPERPSSSAFLTTAEVWTLSAD